MSLFILLLALVCIVEANIEMVQVVFRHGDRAASFAYPLDPYSEADWPRGFSQLTDRGYEQARELGEYLGYRYRVQYPLLHSNYNRKEVYVRSSDKDRCIETAMGVVSSLYHGQVVPVHTHSSYRQDLLLKPNSVSCRRAERLEAVDKGLLYRRADAQFAELFAHLSKHTGMKVSMSNVKDVYNAVFREHSNGLVQPDWVFDRVYPERNETVFENILELKRIDRMTSFNSFEKSRLRTGYLLGRMAEDMNEHAIGLTKRRMSLYSTHDATLTSLSYSLGVSNHLLPPYTSALIIELHKLDEKYFVKVLFRNSTASASHELQMPGCHAVLCPLAQFQSLVADRIIQTRDEYDYACGNKAEKTAKSPATVIIRDPLVALLYLVLALHVYFVLWYYFSSVSKEYLH